VVAVSHKDSPSWYDSPGAYDNAVGTIANLEIARLLPDIPLERSLWLLFCNEEHWPWTSVAAAQGAHQRGDRIEAVFNLDSLGGKGQEAIDAGLKTSVSRYSTPQGKPLADCMAAVNQIYAIGLQQSSYAWDQTGDDDGSFIQAGFPAALMNLGSFPYADPNYHMEGDIPERVDLENVTMATRACLAAILHTAGLAV
jgi:Zn-dependent M28 family amino/carboxypeptidase